MSLFFSRISLNCSSGAVIYCRSPCCTILPFLPSFLDNIPETQMTNFGRSFSTGCIWFLWQALELLGFGVMVQPSPCNPIFSSCVQYTFDSLCCGMFLLEVSTSPTSFAFTPIYGDKDGFLSPPHSHLSFPAACIAVVIS